MDRCIQCDAGRLRKSQAEHRVEVGDFVFEVTVPAQSCAKCAERYVHHDVLERADLVISAWLADHGVRTREAFRFMRKAIGMRAVDLATLLEVTPETVSRWERGALSVEPRAIALLGALVQDALEGRTTTVERLRALREPAEPPRAPVRLPPIAA